MSIDKGALIRAFSTTSVGIGLSNGASGPIVYQDLIYRYRDLVI